MTIILCIATLSRSRAWNLIWAQPIQISYRDISYSLRGTHLMIIAGRTHTLQPSVMAIVKDESYSLHAKSPDQLKDVVSKTTPNQLTTIIFLPQSFTLHFCNRPSIIPLECD